MSWMMFLFSGAYHTGLSQILQDGKTESVGERSNHAAGETKAVEPETLVFANKMV